MKLTKFVGEDEGGTPSPVTTEHHDDDDDSNIDGEIDSCGGTSSPDGEDQSTLISEEEEVASKSSSTNTIASVLRKGLVSPPTSLLAVEQPLQPLDPSRGGVASIVLSRTSRSPPPTTTTIMSSSSDKPAANNIMVEAESSGEEKKMECEGVVVVGEGTHGGSSEIKEEEKRSSRMDVDSSAVVVADSGITNNEEAKEEGGECSNDNSGSKIDPDGSTACLSKSHQSSEQNKSAKNINGSNIEQTATIVEVAGAEEALQPMETKDVDHEATAARKEVQEPLNEKEEEKEIQKENGNENCNGKEAVDAPSAASLETASNGTNEASEPVVPEKKEGSAVDGYEEEGPIIGDIPGAPTNTLVEEQVNNKVAVVVNKNNDSIVVTTNATKKDDNGPAAAANAAVPEQPTMEEDASGRIARSNSNQNEFGDMDTSGFSQSSEAELMKASSTSTTNDSHLSSSSSRNNPKRSTGMDAGGRTSLDLELQQKVARAEETAAAAEVVQQQEPPPTSSVQQSSSEAPKSLGLPTPPSAMEKEASDAAIKAATQPEEAKQVVSQQQQQQRSPLSPDILAIKDKESFALLARGESFKGQQQQQQQQKPYDMLVGQQQQQQQQQPYDMLVGQRRYSNHHRVPQDPAAPHKRGDSSVASLSRMNSGQELDSDNMVRIPDENYDNSHNMPLDDSSWRPSQVSYPSSPQGLPAPQAIPLNNGGYMVMPAPHVPPIPHHPGQPPQHAFMAPQPAMLHHQSSFHSQQQQSFHSSSQQLRPSYGYQTMPAMAPMSSPNPTAPVPGGKRKIKLRLQEEIQARPSHLRRASFFFGGRSTRKLMMSDPVPETDQVNEVDRGTISVSWFEGTSSIELQEHVNRSVERKLKLENNQQLDDIRILDTKVDPPEEIVLCPYIPSGSEFVLRYKLKPVSGRASPTFYGPPDSPSAAPSPHPSNAHLGSLDSAQLAVLRKQLDAVHEGEKRQTSKHFKPSSRSQMTPMNPNSKDKKRSDSPKESRGGVDSDTSDGDSDTLQPESSVDAKLRQITELLLMDRQKQQQQRYPRVEKRQVVFVLANYFVLFVAFITILAEMQARAPAWLKSIESQLENVQTCSSDQEALFKCVSNGEFAGLFATVILWLSRSATTKQIFLLGFDSPQKLWIVFYESLVGAFCWGISYMFIRRGMNPDTRPQFLQKYWKDCMYGSLAGFNATFMKSVLKNLIPREAVEEAFNDRQLKILSWLPTFS